LSSPVTPATGRSPVARRRGAAQVVPAAAWSMVLALLVLAPTLPVGYVLLRDMVFTPQQPFTPNGFGLGSALPRAVPVDAVMAAATSVLSGMVVQKVVLVAVLLLAGLGAAVLVPTGLRLTRCAAASVYVWNAYVAERLLLGHWSLLIAYAALPWLVRCGLRLRSGQPGAGCGAVLLLGVSALTPGGGLLSALVLVPILAWPASGLGVGRRAWVGVAVVLVNAPWWLPGLLVRGGAGSSQAGVDAFAARAELPLGTIGSLIGLGGVWNAQVVPTSRSLLPATAMAVALPVLAVLGWRALRAAWGPVAGALVVSAVGGLALAWAGSAPVLAPALRWAVVHVAGAGLLRDGQRLVAPLALLLAVCAPLGVEAVVRRVGDPAARTAGMLVLVVLPVVVLPDLAWGAWGRLQPVSYPADWQQARSLLAADPPGPASGDVVVLPWQTLRQFGWNADRTVLDPAPRYLDRTTVVADALVVGDRLVPGEDRRSRAVGDALNTGAAVVRTLPCLGIGWVLVETGTPGQVPAGLFVGSTLVYAGPTVSLYRLGDGSGQGLGWGASARGSGPYAVGRLGGLVVLSVDAVVVLLLVGSAAALCLSGRRPAATVGPS